MFDRIMRRRAFKRPSAIPESIIPCFHPGETTTRGVEMWDVSLRLSAVAPLAWVPWLGSHGDLDAATAVIVLAGAGIAGRSAVRWIRVRGR